MGKKKKGKGTEKTLAKTDKRIAQKIKKQLALTGEDDIESIIAQIEKEEKEKNQIVETITSPPSRRAFFTLTSHPEKDELIMFGGEFYNGQDTCVYNDLFFYKISKNEWKFIKSPAGPPPRSSHQAIAIASNKGELWIFGGEFTTKSESQFHHYRDLWVLNLETKRWTKVIASGGPSSRSGHRMVNLKKKIIIFGGYHDNLQDYKYFNDVYAFNLENRTWMKIEPTGTGPTPRSACQMVATPDGKILIWGGYSKIKVKKDIDKGVVHTDMFLLSPERDDETGTKWKWSQIKPGGNKYGERSGVSVAVWGGKAVTFGGAIDNETEEDISTTFFKEMHFLDLKKFIWNEVHLTGKKLITKIEKRKEKTDEIEKMITDDDIEIKNDNSDQPSQEVVTVDDGVFTMTIGPSQSTSNIDEISPSRSVVINHPHERINTSLVVKGSKLFMYGGIYEEEHRQHTLVDFHTLDLQKLNEWVTIIPCDIGNDNWIDDTSSSDEDDDDDESDNSSADMN